MVYFVSSWLSFIPAAWKDDGTYPEDVWPQDAVLCTEEEEATYWRQPSPTGKQLGASVEGRPIWVDVVVPSRPLSEVAEEKRIQMRDACSNEITRSSFQSDALGSIHNYDCRIVDQLNLKVRYDIASSTANPEPLWSSDGTRYQWMVHDAPEIMQVMIDMNEHIKAAQVKLASKLAAVDAATTENQISIIQW